MRLTAWEEERVQLFAAAELARRRRSRGLRLNAPEAIALICDAMLEAARDGGSLAAVEAAGRVAVAPDQVLDGVRELVDEVRLEVLVEDGTRLVVLVDPLAGGREPDPRGPGAIVPARRPEVSDGRERRRVSVTNTSRRTIRVSSHHPFDRVNPRLAFDRSLAAGFRLDLPAGDTERWRPAEEKEVELVRFGGEAGTEA
ncbi:MAG TPA: urease subunit gamma [Candidatus Limnocylindrales bacterium]|nr:urease subunit gamma [Candidatus Limnocylindrales bacterium]